MKTLKIIVTGGTLDKLYLPEQGTLGFTSSIIPEMLTSARVGLSIDVAIPFMIDSLDMNDEYREQILELILADSSAHVLITHGTDTMVETGVFLEHGLPSNHGKSIILTGAMIPARLPHSDAHFNLGFALGAFNSLDSGVHIAMNGQIFPANDCFKNKNVGRFQRFAKPQ